MDNVSGWRDFEGALKVRLEIFEGPLDLLLHLIRSNKIDIYDIPMAEITAQYLDYLELMKELNLDIASEFLLMAATLTHIKSRMLLPATDECDEEEDPRSELVQQLLEYQRYKEASEGLKEMRSRRKLLFWRPAAEAPAGKEEIFLDVSLFELLKVFREVLSTAGEGPAMVVAPDKYSVVDKMNMIVDLLGKNKRLVFRELFGRGSPKGEIIAAFLAVLELVRLRMIRLNQTVSGGEINIAGVETS